MALVGECQGWDEETVLLSRWHAHRDLFPHQPERSRFNRRRRQLAGAINQVRRLLLVSLDLAEDRQCILDSLPVPVMRFHLVPAGNRSGWQAYDARFGRVPSKQATIFGSKRSLLTTLKGAMLDFVLAPANVPELTVGVELLDAHTDLDVLGDKAFISAPVAAELRATNWIRLLTLPRRNALQPVPAAVRRQSGARVAALASRPQGLRAVAGRGGTRSLAARDRAPLRTAPRDGQASARGAGADGWSESPGNA